jgi:hypothetical protein
MALLLKSFFDPCIAELVAEGSNAGEVRFLEAIDVARASFTHSKVVVSVVSALPKSPVIPVLPVRPQF